ncbi:TPA: competence-stimulating peptide ComC [Streptococcus pneumoniae]
MKNTVKLEQFVALKEKDLQNIQCGEMRKMNEKSFNIFNFFNFFRRR